MNEPPRSRLLGIYCHTGHDPASSLYFWIPAFAGMTTCGFDEPGSMTQAAGNRSRRGFKRTLQLRDRDLRFTPTSSRESTGLAHQPRSTSYVECARCFRSNIVFELIPPRFCFDHSNLDHWVLFKI
jgi:hypothetical protein